MESFGRTSKVWNNYKQWKIIVSVMIFLCSLSTSWQTISEFHSGIITANSPIQCEIGELSFENIECSSDSTYFVTLNFDFGQTSDSFFLETRNLELGTFAYDDLPLRIEVPISGSADELLRVIDSQNNDCMRAGEFEVDCNSNECEIGELSFENIECSSDSTYFVTLNFDFGQTSDSFFLETRNLELGTFAYDDLPLRIEVPISGSADELLRVIDSQNNDCMRAGEFEVYCNSNECEIGELSFENIECSSDSTYFVTLNFDFGQTSDSFFLETRNLELGTFAYDDLPLRIEVPISGSADELLRVIDSQNNDCMRAGEFEVDCNSNECEIGELSFENIECSSDSTYFVTLNFDFGQTSDSFFLETRNLELGTFAYDDLPLRIEVPISGSADELLRVIDSQDNDCMRAGEFEVDCQTSSFISPPSIAVKLYPNPTSHFVVIQLEDQLKRQYQIRNLSGQLLQEKPFVSGEEIRLPDLAPGYYIVRIEIDGREWIQKPLVVQ